MKTWKGWASGHRKQVPLISEYLFLFLLFQKKIGAPESLPEALGSSRCTSRAPRAEANFMNGKNVRLSKTPLWQRR